MKRKVYLPSSNTARISCKICACIPVTIEEAKTDSSFRVNIFMILESKKEYTVRTPIGVG